MIDFSDKNTLLLFENIAISCRLGDSSQATSALGGDLKLGLTGRILRHAAEKTMDVSEHPEVADPLAFERKNRRAIPPLFVKAARAMRLTPDGERIQAIASKMDELSREISHEATDAARDLIGVVRVSTMEGFGSFYLAPRLSEFVGRHPLLSVQLVASQTILKLTEREADLSLNMVRPKKGRLMVRRAGHFSAGLYGSPDYLEKAGIPQRRADLQDHAFVTYVDELISVPHVRWLPGVIEKPRTRFACTSLVAQYEAACAGAGLTMLPHFMACREPGLVRVMSSEINLVGDWWLVIHQDLQTVPRIQAVIDFITGVMKRDHAVLMG